LLQIFHVRFLEEEVEGASWGSGGGDTGALAGGIGDSVVRDCAWDWAGSGFVSGQGSEDGGDCQESRFSVGDGAHAKHKPEVQHKPEVRNHKKYTYNEKH
jgi:hypothetical protein